MSDGAHDPLLPGVAVFHKKHVLIWVNEVKLRLKIHRTQGKEPVFQPTLLQIDLRTHLEH